MLFAIAHNILAATLGRKVTSSAAENPKFFGPIATALVAEPVLDDARRSPPAVVLTPLDGKARRSLIAAMAFWFPVWLLVFWVLGTPAWGETQLHRLKGTRQTGQTRQVKAVLEVSGELKLNADGRQVTRMPLKVRANLHYAERVLEHDVAAGTRRAVRLYDHAEAVTQVGEGRQQHQLRSDQQLIVSASDSEDSTLFSPAGPLTREELELVDIPGNSGLLDRLLPDRELALQGTWQHDNALVAQLFQLDAIHQNELTSTLRKVEGNLAIVDLKGAVSGAVAGISTDLEIKAVYNCRLDYGHVTWISMSFTEHRAIGHAEPGFEVTARLRLAAVPAAPVSELSAAALAEFELQPHAGAKLLDFSSSAGGFRFLHDRDWRVMIDRYDVAILRRVEQGDLIAQCNASALPNLKPGQHPQLEAFQADVQRALGDSFGQFVEANQMTTGSGLRVLRAVVIGAVSELPIQWIYYHFSDDEGRQVALVFTMDAKLVERFAGNDSPIVDTLQFQPRDETPPDSRPQRQARRGAR